MKDLAYLESRITIIEVLLKLLTKIILLLIFTQPIVVLSQGLAHRTFTVSDGLPSNTIYDIHQDQEGFLWLATENGLSRFNGSSFKNFNTEDGLPDTEIFDFYLDSKKRLWFQTLNGKLGFYKDGNFYNESNTPYLKEFKFNDLINGILEDNNGQLYFSSSNRICLLNSENQVSTLYHQKAVYYIFKDLQNNIYACLGGTKYQVLSSLPSFEKVTFDYHDFDLSTRCDLLKIDLLDMDFYDILDNTNKNLRDSLSTSNFSRATFKDDKYWIFGQNTPLQIIETKKKTSNLILKDEQINASCIYTDNEGNTWLGSLGNGLYMIADPDAIQYTVDKEIEGNILTAMTLDSENGAAYIGSNDGWLTMLHDKDNIDYIEPSKIKGDQKIRDILKDSYNRLWLCRDIEIDLINLDDLSSANIEEIYPGIGTKSPKTLISHPKSNLVYVATSSPLIEVKFDKVNYTRQSLARQRTTCLLVDNNENIWLGCPTGLWHLKSLGRDEQLYQSTIEKPVSSLAQTENALAVGTKNSGIYLITGKDTTLLTESNGLPSNQIRSLYVDDNQKLWVGTNKGICTIKPIGNGNHEVEYYSESNGLLSNDIVDCQIMDNKMYALSTKGLHIADINVLNKPESQPNLYIERILVNNEFVSISDELQLENKQNNISIELATIYYGNNSELSYEYKLSDYHDEWHKSNGSVIQFEKLPPNEYQLDIKTAIKGITNNQQVSININIAPAWYQRKVVQALLLLLTGAVFIALFKYYLEREKIKSSKEKRILQLEQLALRTQMNPHFIKNSLGAIQHLMITKDLRAANKYLATFGDLVTRMLNQSDQSSIAVEEELNMIELYLSLENLRFDKLFNYKVNYDPSDFYGRRMPSMMIQPLIENSIIHGFRNRDISHENFINITLQREDDYVLCSIEDNGTGIKNDFNKRLIEKTGIALKNIKERVSLLLNEKPKSSFEILSSNDQGTKIKLRLPLYT